MANTKQVECERCNGKGHIRGYSHVQGGVCFKCAGTGTVTKRIPSAATLARQAAKEAERKANFEKEAAQARTDFDTAWEIYKDDARLTHIAPDWKRAIAHDLWKKEMSKTAKAS